MGSYRQVAGTVINSHIPIYEKSLYEVPPNFSIQLLSYVLMSQDSILVDITEFAALFPYCLTSKPCETRTLKMDIFRILADLMHLLSLVIIFLKIRQSKNCTGLSCKTQEIYLIVFLARYSDLLLYFISVYNTTMKCAFIIITCILIFMMRFKMPYKQTYDPVVDDFAYWKYLIPPCAVVGVILAEEYEIFEILWTFSIFLEAFTIVPQLTVLQKMKEVENLTANYVLALGAYRALYIVHWITRYIELGLISYISVGAGILQTALYADFFYYYYVATKEGKMMTLPV